MAFFVISDGKLLERVRVYLFQAVKQSDSETLPPLRLHENVWPSIFSLMLPAGSKRAADSAGFRARYRHSQPAR